MENTRQALIPNENPNEQHSGSELLVGRLHVFVAFDWGDEIDLARARQEGAGTGAFLNMVRLPRTPASIAYRPPPLRFPLGPLIINMPGMSGTPIQSAVATVFDFAGVSVTFQVPFQLTRRQLRDLAASLTEIDTAFAIMQAARTMLEPLHHKLLPAIDKPDWAANFWEEYFVFQFQPSAETAPEYLLNEHSEWLAGLLHLEDEPLSQQEVEEALRLMLRYGPHDMFIPDWGAAILIDRDVSADETLQAIEFANVQLLEYRHIDNRVDDILSKAETLLTQVSRARLPGWRLQHRSLRHLGTLKVEANSLFQRATTVLKLVGDQYLVRVYRQLAKRFHLPEWEEDIQRKLEVLEGVYQVVSHQSSDFRSEFLEIIVILLITIEVLLSIFKH
jgi:hypothetical protein